MEREGHPRTHGPVAGTAFARTLGDAFHFGRSKASIPPSQARSLRRSMRVLVDTNIFLDVLLARQGLATESQQVLDWFESQPGNGWIAWHTLANLYYVGWKTCGPDKALAAIDEILGVFEVSPTASAEARRARGLGMADFEDALQASAAMAARATYIVTRNTRDLRKSPVKAITPDEFLALVDK